jgi:dipeptide/tripeptide permease
MFCSPRNFARMANRAPGQQSGNRQVSPIRVATWIDRQQPQHQPHRPENFLRSVYTCNFFSAISSVIFSFWYMWTSRWVTNVRSTCTFIWTFITYPLIHIHQKKIAPKIAAKIASVNKPLDNIMCCRCVEEGEGGYMSLLVKNVMQVWGATSQYFCRTQIAYS